MAIELVSYQYLSVHQRIPVLTRKMSNLEDSAEPLWNVEMELEQRRTTAKGMVTKQINNIRKYIEIRGSKTALKVMRKNLALRLEESKVAN